MPAATPNLKVAGPARERPHARLRKVRQQPPGTVCEALPPRNRFAPQARVFVGFLTERLQKTLLT